MVIHSDSRGSNSGFWRYHRSLGLIFFASMNQQVPTIQSNANASDFTFTREEFESAPTRQLLRDGRAANAIVWRLRKNGITWTVKDFSKRSWFVRTFIGPFLIRRELAALSRLKNINGIAGRAFRIDRSAMAVDSSREEPVGILIDTDTLPWSMSGIMTILVLARVAAKNTTRPTETSIPIFRWRMKKFSSRR